MHSEYREQRRSNVEFEGSCVAFETTRKHDVDRGPKRGKSYRCNNSGAVIGDCTSQTEHLNRRASASNYTCEIYCHSSFTTDTEVKKHVCNAHALNTPVKNNLNTYKCSVCEQIYRCQGSLKRHLCIHANIKLYRRKVRCGDFASPDSLHLKSRLGGISSKGASSSIAAFMAIHGFNPCTVCGAGFLTQTGLISHLRRHIAIQYYECSVCGQVFVKNSALQNHIRHSHRAEKLYQCSVCETTLKSLRSLKVHLYSHAGRQRYRCNICDKKFVQRRCLRWHLLYVHIGEKQHKCTLCDAAFARKSCLRQHIRTHTGEGRSPCPWCGVFISKKVSTVKKHILAKHPDKSDVTGHVCPVCSKAFLFEGYLEKHMAVHKVDRERYICDACGQGLATRDSLKCHLYTHIGDSSADSVVCDVCGRKFPCHMFLRNHMASHRSLNSAKRHLCEVCDQIFKSKVSLIYHLQSHAGSKPHKCKICGVGFTQQFNIVQHMRTHTGEKPFKCNVCNVAFARKDNIKQHMRTHTGEKPYTCNVCQAKFARSDNFRRHVMRHDDL